MSHALRIGAAIAALALASPAAAQLPVGPETQANSLTTYSQKSPVVAAAPDGTFLVAWASDWSNGTDVHPSSVQLRRFGNAGGPLGTEFQVNQDTPHAQRPARIHVNGTGRFKVVWSTIDNSPCCFLVGGAGRRFRADASPMADEFTVAVTAEYSGVPATSARPTGEFVAARDSYSSIEVRRFDARGDALGDISIEPATGHELDRPGIALAPGGEFVVAWIDREFGSYPWVSAIRAQRYGADASPVGPRIEVAAPAAGANRESLSVTRNAGGDFLVTWTERAAAGPDTSGSSVQARAFGAGGAALGPQRLVNDLTLGHQRLPRAASAPDGSFVVVWQDGGNGYAPVGPTLGADAEVRGRHLSANGVPRGSGFAVNSLTTGDQSAPDVAFLPGGNFVVVWDSDVSAGGDTDQTSVQFRRFRPALFADGFEGGDLARWVHAGA
jgi:hypothetical protein